MTMLAKDIRPKLRGPRYRKARRRLRRQSITGTTWLHPIEFNGLLIELNAENLTPEPEPESRFDPETERRNQCRRCGEYDPSPCLTPGGAIAKNRHAGRGDG